MKSGQRFPQSPQSLPLAQVEAAEPGPPSSQTPLPWVAQESEQTHSAEGVLMMLDPSHQEPMGQGSQKKRVEGPPPNVYDSYGHVLHVSWVVSALYLLLAPHSSHLAAPAELNFPARHGVCVLEPPHMYPAVHCVHPVCVFVVPPIVRDPGAHDAHVDADAALYLVSSPHGAGVLLPSHCQPAAQDAHPWWVFVAPPVVYDLGLQVEQELALRPLYFLSPPQSLHVAAPAAAKVPAVHAVRVEDPSQRWPGVHDKQCVCELTPPPLVYDPTAQSLQAVACPA